MFHALLASLLCNYPPAEEEGADEEADDAQCNRKQSFSDMLYNTKPYFLPHEAMPYQKDCLYLHL